MLFKRKQKKLTLRKVHELYLLLYPFLPEKRNRYLVDEMDEILRRITVNKMEQVLVNLEINTENKNGLELLILLIRKLREINFFEYVEFVQKLSKREA